MTRKKMMPKYRWDDMSDMYEKLRLQTAKEARQENINQYWKRKSSVKSTSHRLNKKGKKND
jgi:hypothetical protein